MPRSSSLPVVSKGKRKSLHRPLSSCLLLYFFFLLFGLLGLLFRTRLVLSLCLLRGGTSLAFTWPVLDPQQKFRMRRTSVGR